MQLGIKYNPPCESSRFTSYSRTLAKAKHARDGDRSARLSFTGRRLWRGHGHATRALSMHMEQYHDSIRPDPQMKQACTTSRIQRIRTSTSWDRNDVEISTTVQGERQMMAGISFGIAYSKPSFVRWFTIFSLATFTNTRGSLKTSSPQHLRIERR